MCLIHDKMRCPLCIKIETYWNVNLTNGAKLHRLFAIKIETYWNVNCRVEILFVSVDAIKIETYWNVNKVKKI